MNTTPLQGKRALVTGSVQGIGLAMAKALARDGVTVVLHGLPDAQAHDAARRSIAEISNAPVTSLGQDLGDPAQVQRMMQEVLEAGPLDILVNNAGIQHTASLADMPRARWDAILAINLSAAFHTTRLALPSMKAKGWGRIINTASAHSLVASPNKSAYVAAKHGIAGFTKTVALEAARDGVTVNCISPGYVWTTLVENQIPDTMKARGLTREQVMNDVLLAAQPTKRFVTPEQVAALALFLCRDDAASITGANLSMDGGWTAA